MSVTPNRQTAEDNLRAWIVAVTGLADAQVIWAHGNAPRPDLTYISLQFVTQAGRGRDGHTVIDTDGEATVYTWDTLTVRALAVGAGGWDRLNRVRLALRGVIYRDTLNAAGFYRKGPVPSVQDLPELVGVDYEPRAVLTLDLGLVQSVAETQGYVDSVTYTLTVYEEDAETVALSETFTAPEEG